MVCRPPDEAGEQISVASFDSLLAETGFDTGIVNTGQASKLADVVRSKLAEAVEAARDTFNSTEKSAWCDCGNGSRRTASVSSRGISRSLDQIAKQRTHYEAAYKGRIPRNLDESLQRRKRGIEDRKQQRDRWLSDTFTVVGTPYLKLAAVFVGE